MDGEDQELYRRLDSKKRHKACGGLLHGACSGCKSWAQHVVEPQAAGMTRTDSQQSFAPLQQTSLERQCEQNAARPFVPQPDLTTGSPSARLASFSSYAYAESLF